MIVTDNVFPMRIFSLVGLLTLIGLPCLGQEWTAADSIRLSRLLEQEGELRLAPLLESVDKPWLDFDATLPNVTDIETPKIRLTLRPYTANTHYDYDPVYQQKIKVDANTWRSDPLAKLKLGIYAQSHRQVTVQPSGHDLMLLFTRDFWRFRARASRKRTQQVLKSYAD